MIELVALLVGALAGTTGAGVATTRWWRRRKRADDAKKDALPTNDPTPVDAADPIGLGDVVVMDEGRGKELWLARRLSLREGEGDPFLHLYDAEGPHRALVALDPLASEYIDVVEPCELPECALLSRRHSSPPSVIDARIDGAEERLVLEGRRTASGQLACAPEVDADGGVLPRATEVLVATYRSSNAGVAVVARDDEKVRSYVGKRVSLTRVSVLKNRVSGGESPRRGTSPSLTAADASATGAGPGRR